MQQISSPADLYPPSCGKLTSGTLFTKVGFSPLCCLRWETEAAWDLVSRSWACPGNPGDPGPVGGLPGPLVLAWAQLLPTSSLPLWACSSLYTT